MAGSVVYGPLFVQQTVHLALFVQCKIAMLYEETDRTSLCVDGLRCFLGLFFFIVDF